MSKRAAVLLTCSAVAAAALIPASGAGASGAGGPAATDSAQRLVRLPGPGVKRAVRRVAFPIACSFDCTVNVRVIIRTSSGRIGPTFLSGTIQGGRARRAIFRYNRAAVQAIRNNVGYSRMRVRVRAVRTSTGQVGIARRTFRFKL